MASTEKSGPRGGLSLEGRLLLAMAGGDAMDSTVRELASHPLDWEALINFAIQERAELERCSQRRWVVDAIRAGLTREPQFGMKEIEALGESNYQLLSIGRNLNQVAKAMNEGRRDSVTIESIERLRQIIDAHTDKVSGAIRASLERWNIE